MLMTAWSINIYNPKSLCINSIPENYLIYFKHPTIKVKIYNISNIYINILRPITHIIFYCPGNIVICISIGKIIIIFCFSISKDNFCLVQKVFKSFWWSRTKWNPCHIAWILNPLCNISVHMQHYCKKFPISPYLNKKIYIYIYFSYCLVTKYWIPRRYYLDNFYQNAISNVCWITFIQFCKHFRAFLTYRYKNPNVYNTHKHMQPFSFYDFTANIIASIQIPSMYAIKLAIWFSVGPSHSAVTPNASTNYRAAWWSLKFASAIHSLSSYINKICQLQYLDNEPI